MTRISTPPAFFTHPVHFPALGSVARVPADSPTAMSTADIPIEKTNRYRKPMAALRVLLTKARTATKAGAPQGAATRPEVAPMRKTEPGDWLPKREAHARSRPGADTGKTSSMASPARTSRFPIPTYAHPFELT